MEPAVNKLLDRINASQPARVRANDSGTAGDPRLTRREPAAAESRGAVTANLESRNGQPANASRQTSRGESGRTTAGQAEPRP
jgi:hypothetical protein